MSDTWRKESRKEWTPLLGHSVSTEQIAVGALQRIADATELMAKRHQELVDARDRAERRAAMATEAREAAERSAIALRGVITKLRREIEALKAPASDADGAR